MSSGHMPSVDQLNALRDTEFGPALAPLFEAVPGFAHRLASERPFESYADLLDRAHHLALELPEEEQLRLIDAHPRIGARPQALSPISFAEQGYDRNEGMDEGTAELQQRLDALNDAYEKRFGFRFVVFVAGRPRAEIADLLEKHLAREREAERRRALADLFAIARDRLSRLLPDQEGA